MNIIRLILRYNRIFILLVVVLPIVAGVYAYETIPKEGEPEITAPIAIVSTVYPGASPAEMESLVTNPIEEELTGLKDVKEIRSSSSEGISVVVVQFEADADQEVSMQKVREKVDDARSELPDDAEDSKIEEISLTDIPVVIVSVVGDLDPIRLRRLAEDVADDLELMPEVLSTDVAGGLIREIQIYLDPERLDQYGLTILDVFNAVKQSDINIPGGMVNTQGRRFLLRTLTEVKKVEDYNRIPLIRQGDRVVFLRDVAVVKDGREEDVSYSRVDGRSSVSISVKKRGGANIIETSDKIRARLEELEKGFPEGVNAFISADQAKFIRETFTVMSNSAVTGLIIVVIVLYFAMGLRNSLITALSIPLSLLMTFIFMKIFGISNNNMVRFSLVLCIGLLVDNAIIVVENAYHHYQLGKDRLTATIDGISEIAMPVIAATLTTMAAFLPMLLMTGDTGEYMSYMPKTVTMALTSSLIIALIASPLVLSRFMKQAVKDGRVVRPEEDLRSLKRLYVHGVSWALNHRFWVVTLMLVSLAGAFGLLGLKVIEVQMFPDADFDYIYITIETPPGTDAEITDAAARKVEGIVRDHVPEAVQVVSVAGARSQSAFEITVGQGLQSNFAEVTLELLAGKEYDRVDHQVIRRRIRPMLEAIPGANIRYRALAWGPPRFAPVVVKVIGPDLDILRDITVQVKDILTHTPGTTDIKDDFSDAPPELIVRVDRAAAASLGVPLDAIALSLRGATAGMDVRDFQDELDVSKKYKLKVRYSPESRTSPDMLDKVKIRSASGALVPLSNLAAFAQGPGINTIRHADRRRVVRATAQAEGRPAVEITKEVMAKVKKLEVPRGYEFSFEGDFKDTEESFASLKLAYVVAFIIIFALLVSQFNSFFQPFAIMTALPLSVVGAMIGLLVTRNNFSIFSFVGLVGLTGIVVNDSIVLVDCINRTRSGGQDVFNAVIAAGQQRLRPIISTTVTTIGGIITLTITDELWEGLGVVIIFGIAFATVLTLVVVPVMYSIFEGMGQFVVSAFRAPLWPEAPRGRGFYFTRRRYARFWFWLTILAQAAAFGAGVYFIGPYFFNLVDSAVIQAPSLLKTAIEIAVFALTLAAQSAAVLLVLLLPTWVGLLFLMGRRSKETYFVDVTPDGVAVTSPAGRLFLPAGELSMKHSRQNNRLTLLAGRRRVNIRKVVEDKREPAKTPLKTWLDHPPPKSHEIKNSMDELQKAVQNLLQGHYSGE